MGRTSGLRHSALEEGMEEGVEEGVIKDFLGKWD